MASNSALLQFMTLNPAEQVTREYYIAHSNKRRFRPSMTCLMLLFAAVTAAVLVAGPIDQTWPTSIPTGLITLLLIFRPMMISHVYAALTSERLVFYTYTPHRWINAHRLDVIGLDDVSAFKFEIKRSWIRRSFVFFVWSPTRYAFGIEAKKTLKVFKRGRVEPGPDAETFAQEITARFAEQRARQLDRRSTLSASRGPGGSSSADLDSPSGSPWPPSTTPESPSTPSNVPPETPPPPDADEDKSPSGADKADIAKSAEQHDVKDVSSDVASTESAPTTPSSPEQQDPWIVQCPNCTKRVVPTAGGRCPACQKIIPAWARKR